MAAWEPNTLWASPWVWSRLNVFIQPAPPSRRWPPGAACRNRFGALARSLGEGKCLCCRALRKDACLLRIPRRLVRIGQQQLAQVCQD